MSPPNVADLAVIASTSTKAEPNDDSQITRHVQQQTLCLHCSRTIYRYVYGATATQGETFSDWYHKETAVASCDWPPTT